MPKPIRIECHPTGNPPSPSIVHDWDAAKTRVVKRGGVSVLHARRECRRCPTAHERFRPRGPRFADEWSPWMRADD